MLIHELPYLVANEALFVPAQAINHSPLMIQEVNHWMDLASQQNVTLYHLGK